MARNRILYGTVVLVLLLFVFLRAEAAMAYLALYAVLLAPLFSLATAHLAKRRIAVSQRLGADAVAKGETVPYIATIQNQSWFPLFAARIRLVVDRGLNSDYNEALFSIRPRRSEEITFHIYTSYRGRYQVGIADLSFYDSLGLFHLRQKPPTALRLTVTPRIWPIASLPLYATIGDMAQAEVYKKGEDYSTISDLRKYNPTDGHKKIHWKASAKRSELISKSFEAPQRQSAVFLIDNSAIPLPPEAALSFEDSMMEALVSAMSCASGQGYHISLRAPGHPDTDFTENFSELYQRSVDLTFGSFGDFGDCLNRYVTGQTEPLNLILIVQKLDARICGALEALQTKGSHVIVLYLDNLKGDPLLGALQETNVSCFNFCELQKR